MRGEKAEQCADEMKVSGSPPRARGKGLEQSAVLEQTGITPACAGKRSVSGCPASAARDHPRVRGEKSQGSTAPLAGRGSPPRARGKGQNSGAGLLSVGITPACAGKRFSQTAPWSTNWDHPRVRGEKALACAGIIVDVGSPPRARGKVNGYEITALAAGITPACAGKSCRGNWYSQ